MQGAMHGLRVVEVAQWWFVPAAGAVLADWGADVIKIEHPRTGDPLRGLISSGLAAQASVNYMVEQANRGKRGVGLDLATDGGRELLHRLVRGADVFLTSFLPAARRKLRIDVDDLRAINPRLVYVRGHGHGVRGPDVEKGGYDAASFWSRGGIAHALTPPGASAPIMQRAAFGDSTGAMTIAGGIAAALLARERTGRAPVVDVSLLGTAMWILAPDILSAKLSGATMGAMTDRRRVPNPIVNSYLTRDGRWLFLNMLQPSRYWADLCRHLGREDLIADPRFADDAARARNAEACVEELSRCFAQHTLAEWRIKLATVEGVWAAMQSAAEIPDDPQVEANGYLAQVEVGAAACPLVRSPVQFDESLPELRSAPEIGQHTEDVLLELGLGWDELAAYKRAGAIS
jgi:crotonobetainyl-CoA:carnitine CoA-transferase CaiB-like acyl-CoA transferase